jgi:GNAT superfamily N-acetyltransferase
VFFLLSIQLDEQFRGVGNGEQLYNTLTEIAREIGCREIRQSPSGRTATKQSRVAYLRKRGWVSDGCEAFKSLIACGP